MFTVTQAVNYQSHGYALWCRSWRRSCSMIDVPSCRSLSGDSPGNAAQTSNDGAFSNILLGVVSLLVCMSVGRTRVDGPVRNGVSCSHHAGNSDRRRGDTQNRTRSVQSLLSDKFLFRFFSPRAFVVTMFHWRNEARRR